MSTDSSETDARAARLALERLLARDPIDLAPGLLDRLEAFVLLLLSANRQTNLTRVVEPEAVARLHLLDSLAALPLVDHSSPALALDLGSGGGVPGIVLALARPEIHWTLLDSVRKKADAMRDFADALGLPNAAVVEERAEVLGHDPAHRERHDLVAARAVAPLAVLAEYALPLLRIGGSLLAWKGPIAEAELRGGASASGLLGGGAPEVLPAGFEALGEHRFVLIRKVGPTPDRYPRRPGEPARRPLSPD